MTQSRKRRRAKIVPVPPRLPVPRSCSCGRALQWTTTWRPGNDYVLRDDVATCKCGKQYRVTERDQEKAT